VDSKPISERHPVVIGTPAEARRWAEANGRSLPNITVADRVRRLIGRSGPDTHLIIMPSYWTMPDHFLRRVEVQMLQAEGATVQWED
jgi:hypothetical protein